VAKKRKKKIPLRTQIRRLEKKADRAMSEFVRAKTIIEFKGKCPICDRGPIIPVKPCRRNKLATEGPAIECCFHFIRRKRKVLRWDIRNVVGACHKCNWVEYRDPDLSRAWYIRRYGADQYLDLVDESKGSFVPDVGYLERVIKGYEDDLAKLKKSEAAK
jgi:hypothetical protein